MGQAMSTHKVEQVVIATAGFFWCFLMWFSTAAFSPSIAAHLGGFPGGRLAG